MHRPCPVMRWVDALFHAEDFEREWYVTAHAGTFGAIMLVASASATASNVPFWIAELGKILEELRTGTVDATSKRNCDSRRTRRAPVAESPTARGALTLATMGAQSRPCLFVTSTQAKPRSRSPWTTSSTRAVAPNGGAAPSLISAPAAAHKTPARTAAKRGR